jgi:hypothetical protein
MLHTGWGLFYTEKTDDGGSITAVKGSTSEKKYLCQVPNFGVLNNKEKTGWVTSTGRESRCSVSISVA